VEIGDRAEIGAADLPVELHAERHGRIVIGADVRIGGGTSIEATDQVLIGNGAHLGRSCKVLDNGFHTLGDLDHRPSSQTVEIGRKAIIGDGAIVLPGARIGPAQIVPPGAVVWAPRPPDGTSAPSARAAPAEVPNRGVLRVSEKLRNPLDTIQLIIAWLRAFVLFRRDERSSRIQVRGPLKIRRGGALQIGSLVTFEGGMIPTSIATQPGSLISIGESCYFNYGVTLDASIGITLGVRCKIGSMVVLKDHDGDKRLPIVVGDRVWLAHGVIVKPGVRIGSGSVVSAGSVVVGDVPENSMVIGNPGISRPTKSAR
jgi:acetyltransferase-like isoleucine patch superfamily enzyme